MGRKSESHESLPTEASPEGDGRGHLRGVHGSEETRGVMPFNPDNHPTSCGRPGPLPTEATDDRGENQTQACPLEAKLVDRDARGSAGGIPEDDHQSGGESERGQAWRCERACGC